MLQTRNAKRTGLAGVRWAVEMATGKDFYTGESQTKILSQKEALMSLSGDDLEQLLFPIFDSVAEESIGDYKWSSCRRVLRWVRFT